MKKEAESVVGQNIFEAASEGNLVRVRELLGQGVDVNQVDKSGLTALYLASREGYAGVVSVLLAHPAIDPNIAGFRHRNTPLHVAINNSHTDVVMVLIASDKVNLGRQNWRYDTPLDCAVCKNNVVVVKRLVEKKAALSTEIHVLFIAAKNKYYEVYKLLVEHGINPYCNEGSYVQKRLVRNFYSSEIRRGSRRRWGRLFCQVGAPMKKRKVDIGAQEQLLAFMRDFHGLRQLIGGMILRYCNPYTAADKLFKIFYDACYDGDQGKVDRLLPASGFDVNQTMREPRVVLFVSSSEKTLPKSLTEQAFIADLTNRAVNDEERPVLCCTALHMASGLGHEAVVDRLLRVDGIDVNVAADDYDLMPFKYGLTPLYVASQEGRCSVVRSLLAAKGIDVNKAIAKVGGGTPLSIACQKDHVHVVEQLLSAPGVDVKQGRNGLSPLHIACFKGHKDVVLQLIKAGAGIEDRGDVDMTPLMLARENGHKAVEGALLAAGAVDQVAEESAAPSFSS